MLIAEDLSITIANCRQQSRAESFRPRMDPDRGRQGRIRSRGRRRRHADVDITFL